VQTNGVVKAVNEFIGYDAAGDVILDSGDLRLTHLYY